MKNNRRDFLKKSATAAAALSVAGIAAVQEQEIRKLKLLLPK